MRRFPLDVAVIACVSWLAACVEFKPGTDRRDVTDVFVADVSNDGGMDVSQQPDVVDIADTVDAPVDAATDVLVDATDGGCPTVESRPRVMVSGQITANATWSCQNLYVLNGIVTVTSPAVLTVLAGTEVHGAGASALVIARGATIQATGTHDAPIVFTSDRPVGMRSAGDWGGLVLIGWASTSNATTQLLYSLPPGTIPAADGGMDAADAAGTNDPNFLYAGTGPSPSDGGTDAAVDAMDAASDAAPLPPADDSWNCGTLHYVRLEFGGFAFPGALNPSVGLGLAACGRATSIDYVQVYDVVDDGVQVWGGTVDLRHVIATRTENNTFNFKEGYRGRGQFLLGQSEPMQGSRGVKFDNLLATPFATPRTLGLIYNITVVGPHSATIVRQGIGYRRGGWGVIRNAIVMGFYGSSVFAEDRSSLPGFGTNSIVENSYFFQIGPSDNTWFSQTLPDSGVDQAGIIMDPAHHNHFGEDPVIPFAYNSLHPALRPHFPTPVTADYATPPNDGFFDTTVNYVGGVAPETVGPDWTAGWTAYPQF